MNAELEQVFAAQRALQDVYKAQVRRLGADIGYGNMMVLARDCWRESLAAKDYPLGGEHSVGPCVALTVPCDCRDGMCDWCCGSGWLTKRVKEAKDAARARRKKV